MGRYRPALSTASDTFPPSFCALRGGQARHLTICFLSSSKLPPAATTCPVGKNTQSFPLMLSRLFCSRIPGNGAFLKAPGCGDRDNQPEDLQSLRNGKSHFLPLVYLFITPPHAPTEVLLQLTSCFSKVIRQSFVNFRWSMVGMPDDSCKALGRQCL